jgi:hypothetical protein
MGNTLEVHLDRSVRECAGLDYFVPDHAPVVGPCEHDNELSGSTKGGTLLDKLSDYKLISHTERSG